MSASSTWLPPRAPRTRRVSSACVALRFGRKPYERRTGSPPRRSAPARASPPSAPLGLGPSGCPAAAAFHRPSGCTAAAPAAVDTCLHAVRRRALRARRSTPVLLDLGERHRIDARRAAVLLHPLPCFPQDVTPRRCGHTAHGSGAPGAAWPRPTVGVAIVALCRRDCVHRGDWNRSCRPCPRACLLGRHAHRRDPSLPSRYSSRGLVTTTIPSDSRCAALAFALGLYEPRCRDDGCADGPLVFRSSPCHACCAPYPAETSRACISGLRRGETWPSP